jgi:hypothetical protein
MELLMGRNLNALVIGFNHNIEAKLNGLVIRSIILKRLRNVKSFRLYHKVLLPPSICCPNFVCIIISCRISSM